MEENIKIAEIVSKLCDRPEGVYSYLKKAAK